MNTRAIFGWLMAAAFLAAMTVMIVYAYNQINEPSPTQDSHRALLSTVVKRGEYLTLQNAFTSEKQCAGFFSRSIYASNGVRILSESEYRPAAVAKIGRNIQATRSFRIPDDAPLGKARYASVVEWTCNPLQRIWPQVDELPELQFEIVPAPKRSGVQR